MRRTNPYFSLQTMFLGMALGCLLGISALTFSGSEDVVLGAAVGGGSVLAGQILGFAVGHLLGRPNFPERH